MNQKSACMEQKLNLRFVLMGLLSLVLTALLCGGMFHAAFTKQVWTDLASETSQIAQVYEHGIPRENLADFASEELRVSLISPAGEVLYDSDASGALENHLSRAEVGAALSSGEGTAVRKSETVGFEAYYYAKLLPDGNVLRLCRHAKGIYAIYNAVLPAVAIGCLFVLAAGVALSILLTRQLVRPILKMGENLEDLGHAAPYQELQPFMDALAADRRLRDSNAQMRRDFTANVSHELKTPLTSISGYAELIATGLAKPADTPGFALRIQAEAQRMLRLVGDIIQLSELDSLSSDSEPDKTRFLAVDLQGVAKSCAESLSMTAQKAFLTMETTGAHAVVQGDANLLEELCYNLGDNAIRYNRPGGRVTLSTGTENGTPFLRVADTGIGIPPESQSRVFERFYRVDKSRSKATGGTGLGLAIVKHIAMLHGARVRLESTFGSGTTVTVLFGAGG